MSEHEAYPNDPEEYPQELDEETQRRLKEIQTQFDQEQDSLQQDLEQIRKKYFKLMQPHLKARSQATKKIEGFWLAAFDHHPELHDFTFEDSTRDALAHLIDISFDEPEGSDSIKMTFEFSPNPYFENEYLSVTCDKEQYKATPIRWHPKKNIFEQIDRQNKQARDGNQLCTIFQIFKGGNDPQNLELITIIRDEVYIDPVDAYINDAAPEEEEGEEFDEEEGDEEANEEAEEEGEEGEDEGEDDGEEEEENGN